MIFPAIFAISLIQKCTITYRKSKPFTCQIKHLPNLTTQSFI